MKNPLEGWKILTDILETGGIMKIALYSKLARRELLEFKRKIEIKYKLINLKDVRELRNTIINDNLIKLPKIFNSIDFFSTSGFKDLLLNENEIGEYFMGQNIYDSSANYNINFYRVSKDVNNPKNNFSSLTKEIC